MESMRSTWTDSRLDDLAVDTKRRFDRLEGRMDDGFRDLRGEIARLQRTMVYCFATLSTATLAGFVAMMTQL